MGDQTDVLVIASVGEQRVRLAAGTADPGAWAQAVPDPEPDAIA
ncbi:hypothetical protein PV963_04355 [Streptomyces coeruleorubidus]|nr:hypothetical protein [Streptomyces coeruleorubidus]WDV49651.1 hypothetical protein PV963_04355 [Streptomyces coeruleorubidus]